MALDLACQAGGGGRKGSAHHRALAAADVFRAQVREAAGRAVAHPFPEIARDVVRAERVGGQRRIVVPPELGYGDRGAPGVAGGETLVFVIDLLDVG